MSEYQEVTDMNQYLTFTLANEVFGMDISQVREVLEVSEITTIPRMPDFLCGVINLRGNAVPVMDMRLKMNMRRGENTVDTCVIITEVQVGDERVLSGCLVDSVREVYELPPEEVMLPPNMGKRIKTDFIRGMGRQDEGFVIIVDIDKVLSEEELAASRDAAALCQ